MLNEYYKNITAKEYIKRYGIANSVFRGIFNKCVFHYVEDYEMRKVLWQRKISKRLKKYLKYRDVVQNDLKFPCCEINDNPIWIYWNDGIKNAPPLVQRCYYSVLEQGYNNVVLIDENSVSKYVIFPNYIIEKANSGCISRAHYTDLLRFALLKEYGGTWIDATVFLSGRIPEVISNSDFFAPRNAMCLVDNPALFAVWFIHSKPHNKVVEGILNVSLAYWKHEMHVQEYLMSNIIMTELINGANCQQEIPYLNADCCERLVRIVGDEYSEAKVNWILGLSPIHKLTYKLDESVNRDGSIYRWLLRGEDKLDNQTC